MKTMSIMALKAAISTLEPQALELNDGYYFARFAVAAQATDANITLVSGQLPQVLAAQVGGPVRQFNVMFHQEGGYRWITLRRRALVDMRPDFGRRHLDEFLDRDVFALIEQLVTPRYQGAVSGEMEARLTTDGRIALTLVRQCGRWRVAFPDLERHFRGVISRLSMQTSGSLRFLIDGDTPNERIAQILIQVANHLELYFPPHISLKDSTEVYADQVLQGIHGNYRFWIDFEANKAPAS